MQGKNIILAAMPKSGSTFVSRKLSELIGYPLKCRWTDVEIQQLDPVKVNQWKNQGLIEHIHLFGTHNTIKILNSYNPQVIIQWRNLLDTVVSVRDFNLSDEMAEALERRKGLTTPGSVFEFDHFRRMSMEKQYSFVIDTYIPWCINFFVSWKMRAHMLNVEPIWIDYNTFFSDPANQMDKILRHCGFEIGKGHIERTLVSRKLDTRLNKGVSGRGLQELSEEHIRRIETLLDYYPPHYVSDLRPHVQKNMKTEVCI